MNDVCSNMPQCIRFLQVFYFYFQICKKLSGAAKGTAEWCTNVGNEYSQILACVLTCEESVARLKPMMDRYSRADEDPPVLLYVDRDCCTQKGPSCHEQLFDEWVEAGMAVRLDPWHWMHRFDAAIRTDAHPKYAVFKSALSGALFAYNKADLDVVMASIRAGLPQPCKLSDDDLMAQYVTKRHLRHHVRHVTVGAQETSGRVELADEELKGPAGLDENGIPLFKSDKAIDEVWERQKRHLECIQDLPEMAMYLTRRHVTKNGVKMPFYTTKRGNNSLEGFHCHLPRMIPGDHCEAAAFQTYLVTGLARWNADREVGALLGGKGRQHLVYSSSLLQRVNERSKAFFGEA